MKRLTNSALQCFHACHKKYDIQYNHRCRPEKEATALAVGTAFHEWKEKGTLQMGDDDDACLVWAMAAAYMEYWPPEKRVDLAEKEKYLESPLRNPVTGMPSRTFRRAGKCDGVAEMDGGVGLYELKTTGTDVDSVVSMLRRGTQIPTYAGIWAEMYPGRPVVAAIVDVVKKPRLKRREGEAPAEYIGRLRERMLREPESYFRQEVIPWSQAWVEETNQLYWDTAKLIRLCDQHGYTAARGAHCKSFFGGCEYRRICWYSDHTGYRISDKEHEEL